MTRLLFAAALAVAVASRAPAARAENPMGYRLLSEQDATGLPRGGGSLGLNVGRAQQVSDSGLTFDVMRVNQVRGGSPAAKAGFKPGDDVIAVDGQVFPSIAVFARYVGSVQPGTAVAIDYIPTGGGPAQAQRVSVLMAAANGAAAQGSGDSAGLSTGEKVAIGVGAAALLGCYEMGCFSHRGSGRQPSGQAPAQTAPTR